MIHEMKLVFILELESLSEWVLIWLFFCRWKRSPHHWKVWQTCDYNRNGNETNSIANKVYEARNGKMHLPIRSRSVSWPVSHRVKSVQQTHVYIPTYTFTLPLFNKISIPLCYHKKHDKSYPYQIERAKIILFLFINLRLGNKPIWCYTSVFVVVRITMVNSQWNDYRKLTFQQWWFSTQWESSGNSKSYLNISPMMIHMLVTVFNAYQYDF